jgi:hypothetical protein
VTLQSKKPVVLMRVFNTWNKRPVIANVAIARELTGWCWSLAVLDV